ncbi:MAG: S8 family serine peptidase, partial [Chitinophagaceae bacterium]
MLQKLSLYLFSAFVLFAPFFSLSQQEKQQNNLEKISKLYAEKEKQDKIKLLRIAQQKRWALSLKTNNPNQTILLTGVDINGLPIYTTTNNNIIAAATTRTNKLWQGGLTGFNLSGASTNIQGKIAMWDGGLPMPTHIELNNKIVNKDFSSTQYHSTHVAGTLIANGTNPLAKGMAYGTTKLDCYNFNNHISEMFSAASNLLISNHSYGAVAGWNYTFAGDWEFNGKWGDSADYKFGWYNDETQMFDSIAYNAPYYLIVKSVGNNRDKNGPDVGTPYRRFDINGNMVDAGNRPIGISFNNTYDVIPTYGVAKNILTVGAVEGIANGSTNSQDIKMAAFSNWGPTDDGRIKPDLVADGISVLSCTNNSTNSYDEMSGTSMAAPNVTGSLYLLQELFSKKNAGVFMKAATAKALAIHTATEAGISAGPDYQFGWGLLNAEKAANIINNPTTDKIIEATLNNGSIYSMNVIASGKGKLMATIVWTDPVGTITTTNLLNNPSLKLIHDLDIRIVRGLKTYFPWVLDPANPGATATKGDNFRDNVERVEVDDVVPGETYTIQISHKGILQRGSQDFSLIISGVGGTAYCNSAATQTLGSRIDNVTFAGINNNNPLGCTAYNNFTNLTAEVEPSAAYPLSIAVSTCDGSVSSKVIKVFIDYNNNGNFTDANETVATSGIITTNSTFTTNITIPHNLVINNYSLMRVVVQETNDANTVTPCNTYSFGETQDYRILFTTPAIDIAITNIEIPTNNTCSNKNQYVSVLLSNTGKNGVSNIPLTAVVKNGANTIATLTGTYIPSLASGTSVVYTFQTPFTSVGSNTYNITATTTLSSDQNTTNNTNSSDIIIAPGSATATGQANVCGNTASLRAFNTNNNQNYLWYNAATATSPIATGINTTTSTISNTYFIGSGISTKIGAVDKTVFSNGDYQAKGGNYFKYTSTVPLMLENARLYTAYPGKVTIKIADIKATLPDGSYTYNTLSSTTIDVLASRPNNATGDVAGNDPTDLGLIYNINLLLPSGSHAIIVSTDNVANIFRNNGIANNPYPYNIPNIISITGNNATNPEQYYYYLYNMSVRTLDCQSDRVAVIPTVAAAPIISYSGDSLVCTSGINYQWKKGGIDLVGENNQTYKPVTNGSYSCFVTDNTGCQQLSNILAYPPTSNGNILTIQPNPANSFIDVKFGSSST